MPKPGVVYWSCVYHMTYLIYSKIRWSTNKLLFFSPFLIPEEFTCPGLCCYDSSFTTLQRPRMWLMWPGSPPRQRGQQSGEAMGWITSICCSCCWLDRVNVWDVSIGHSAERSCISRHTLFGVQLQGSSSVSKLLFFSNWAHCMLTKLAANKAS